MILKNFRRYGRLLVVPTTIVTFAGCAHYVQQLELRDPSGKPTGQIGGLRYHGDLLDPRIVVINTPNITKTTTTEAVLPPRQVDSPPPAPRIGDEVTILSEGIDCNGKKVVRERTGKIIEVKGEAGKPQVRAQIQNLPGEEPLQVVQRTIITQDGYVVGTEGSLLRQTGEFLANVGAAAGQIMFGWGTIKIGEGTQDYGKAAREGKLADQQTINNGNEINNSNTQSQNQSQTQQQQQKQKSTNMNTNTNNNTNTNTNTNKNNNNNKNNNENSNTNCNKLEANIKNNPRIDIDTGDKGKGGWSNKSNSGGYNTSGRGHSGNSMPQRSYNNKSVSPKGLDW